jgi:hypothetical protein
MTPPCANELFSGWVAEDSASIEEAPSLFLARRRWSRERGYLRGQERGRGRAQKRKRC